MKQTRIEDVLQKRDVEPLKKAGIRTLEQLILYHSYDLPLSKAAAGRVLSAAAMALARKYFKDVTYDNDVVFIRTEKSPVTKKTVEHFFSSLYRQIEEVADGYKVICKTEGIGQRSIEWCKSSLREAAIRLSSLIARAEEEEEDEEVIVEEEEEELEELEGVEEEKPESFEEFASLFFSEIHGNDLMKKCLAASLLSTPEEPVHTLVVGEPGTAKTLAVDLLSSLKDVEVAGPLVTRAGLVINYQSGELGVLPQANGKIVVIDEFDKAPKQDFKLTYELISTGRCVVHAANIHKIIRSRFVLIAMANPTHGVFKGGEGDLPFEFHSGDNVIFSCRTIPTKETIENREHLEKLLHDKGVKIWKDVHVSGHGRQEDARILINMLKPEHIILSHGDPEKVKGNKKVALSLGYSEKNIHIVNLEDENSSYFLKIPSRKKITFGLEKGDFNLKNTGLKLKVPGRFNLYNGLAAFSFALSQGVESELAKKALLDFSGVPGRMEEVISAPFKVFVDYAFTPNALEKVYQELKEDFQPNKMICVLGACGGGRDKWKRPVLGKIAREHCQEIIIANEDPYDENPMAIINQVAEGAGERAFKILDRREAIRKALELARPGDLVVVTGKGCEPWICLAKGKKVSWDDRRVVKEEFERLQGERVDKDNKDNRRRIEK